MPDPVDSAFGSLLPSIRTEAPGASSRAMLERLRAVECRDVTYGDGAWPTFWESARGSNVRDVDGNVYVDLTGAFGVALLGHAHPAVTCAIERQLERVVHGMGDVHPPEVKLRLLERIRGVAPWDDAKATLASTGSEAVEIALKTALLATGRPGIMAFEGGYHGLTLGALATTHRPHFRRGFESRVYPGAVFAPFPDGVGDADGASALDQARRILRRGGTNGDPIGAIIVEPVQGRAGVRVPPAGFMAAISEMAREAGALVIADEILTGLGRCGALFASELVGLEPDLVCLGKALGGGLPISACVGPASVMDAWPPSEGEAIHTSTFLGHPLSCAAALAVLDHLEADAVPDRAATLGSELAARLGERLDELESVRLRGLGLLLGIDLGGADGTAHGSEPAVRVAKAALAAGVLVLPAGDRGQVVELTPAVTLTPEQAAFGIEVVADAIGATA